MSNFKPRAAQPHKRLFLRPAPTADDELDGLLPGDEPYTEEEKRLRRRDQARVLHGVADFLLVALGVIVILALVLMLLSLINWVHDDIVQSFALWQTRM